MLGDFTVAATEIHSTSLYNWQGVDHLYFLINGGSQKLGVLCESSYRVFKRFNNVCGVFVRGYPDL